MAEKLGPIRRRLASGNIAVVNPRTGVVETILPGVVGGLPDDEPDHQECHNCRDGIYYISGAVVNGVFRGKTGTCFQCQGKGYTTPADRQRTENYYKYHYRLNA